MTDKGHLKHMKSLILLAAILILPLQNLQAQSWDELEEDFCNSGQVGINLFKNIVPTSKETQKNFLIGTGITAIALLADNSIRDFSQKNRSDFADKVFEIDTYYGSTKYMIGAPLIIYAGGFLSGNKTIKEMGLQSTQAVLYTGLITMITKVIVGRARPFLEKGPYSIKPFSLDFDNRSFWSGHTSSVFAMSTVMASKIDNIFWKIAWYGAATIVGGARIYHDKHWFSDVVTGAMVGYAVGRFVVNQNDAFSEQSIGVSPSINTNGTTMLHFSIPLY